MLDRRTRARARGAGVLAASLAVPSATVGWACPPSADDPPVRPESISGLHADEDPPGTITYELDWTSVGPSGWSPPHGIPIDAYVPFGRQDPPDRLFVPGGDLWIEVVPHPTPPEDALDDATRRLLDAIAGWEPVLAGEALAALATDESLPLELRSASALRLAERVEPGSARAADVLATVLRAWMRRD